MKFKGIYAKYTILLLPTKLNVTNQTLFSALESETGLCFCLEVDDDEGRVEGADVDLMLSVLCFVSFL